MNTSFAILTSSAALGVALSSLALPAAANPACSVFQPSNNEAGYVIVSPARCTSSPAGMQGSSAPIGIADDSHRVIRNVAHTESGYEIVSGAGVDDGVVAGLDGGASSWFDDSDRVIQTVKHTESGYQIVSPKRGERPMIADFAQAPAQPRGDPAG